MSEGGEPAVFAEGGAEGAAPDGENRDVERGPDGEVRRGRRRGRRGGRRRRGRENGVGDQQNGDGVHVGELNTPFPADHTHPASPSVHPDETFEPARVDVPSATNEQEKRGFFSKLWGKKDTAPESQAPAPTPVTYAPVAEAPPPPRPAPVVESAPPPPPPRPAPVVESAPPPPPPVQTEPVGPPRKGWWSQPGKTE